MNWFAAILLPVAAASFCLGWLVRAAYRPITPRDFADIPSYDDHFCDAIAIDFIERRARFEAGCG